MACSRRRAFRGAVVTALICGLQLGCVAVGVKSVGTVHEGYGESLARTLDHQLLVNLVRLRYRDTPYFLEFGNVTSQLTLTGTASLGTNINVGTPTGTNATISPNLGTTYSVTPTVVMSPLQGDAFVRRLMARLPLTSLLMLMQSGWGDDRVLQIAVDRINDLANAPSAAGPTPEEAPRSNFARFHDLAAHLRALQKADLIVTACRQCRADEESASAEHPREGHRHPQVIVRMYCRPEML